jgi:Cytochrome c oxidase biogenesis protein Cmc1 like
MVAMATSSAVLDVNLDMKLRRERLKLPITLGITYLIRQIVITKHRTNIRNTLKNPNAPTAVWQKARLFHPILGFVTTSRIETVCRDFIEALEECHASGWQKFIGGCNVQKDELNHCLRTEVRL